MSGNLNRPVLTKEPEVQVYTGNDHRTTFQYEENADGNVYLHVKDSTVPRNKTALAKAQKDRQNISIRVPEIVAREGYSPSRKEQKAVAFYEMKGLRRNYWKMGDTQYFTSCFLNEKNTQPVHPKFTRLQELFLAHAKALELLLGTQNGNIINLSVSVQQGHQTIQPHGTLWPPQKAGQATRDCIDDTVTTEMIQLIGSLTVDLMNIALPTEFNDLLRHQYNVEVSLCAANHDNHYTSSIQANVSLVDAKLAGAIGAGGGVHIDGKDDPGRVNIAMYLSHLHPDYHPGKSLLLNDKMYCITAPYTALVSSGAFPHWPINPSKYEKGSIRYVPAGPIPAPSSSPDHRRIVVVSYPQIEAMRRAPNNVQPIMFEQGSLLCHGTERNLHEYAARSEAGSLRDKAKSQAKPIPSTELDRIIRKHSWIENGVKQQPRRQIISETLFGSGESDPAFKAREHFIDNHVSCQHSFGGKRKADPVLVGMDGKEVATGPGVYDV